MTTLAQVVKTIVENAIDQEYIAECGYSTLREVYEAEYGYNGFSQKACTDYLQGLPSACTIPFNNSEVLDILEKHGIARKTENSRYTLIEQYWLTAGKVFYSKIK